MLKGRKIDFGAFDRYIEKTRKKYHLTELDQKYSKEVKEQRMFDVKEREIVSRACAYQRKARRLGALIYPDGSQTIKQVDVACRLLNRGKSVLRSELPRSIIRMWICGSILREDEVGPERLLLDKARKLIKLRPGFWKAT